MQLFASHGSVFVNSNEYPVATPPYLDSKYFMLNACYAVYAVKKWDNLLLTALAYRKGDRRTLPTWPPS